jgi:hypothetical protein
VHLYCVRGNGFGDAGMLKQFLRTVQLSSRINKNLKR